MVLGLSVDIQYCYSNSITVHEYDRLEAVAEAQEHAVFHGVRKLFSML